MLSISARPARRAAFAVWVAALIVGWGWACVTRASEITASDDFRDMAAAVADYADEVGPERTLLVLDIDNTLLAMNQDLGSDQWFEWQKYLLDHEPRSKHLVADSFDGLLDAQGLLYNLGRMHPPQPDLPRIIRRLQNSGIYTLVLTSRGDEYRVATERELVRNGYDFERSALPVDDLPGGTYQPYYLENLASDGLTAKDAAAFGLTEPRPVSYENGLYMTAGQPKGAMMLAILHHARPEIRAVVYADDHIRHVAYVFAAMASRDLEIKAFHYTREEPRVKRFQYGDKQDVGRRWRKLSHTLEEIFE
ncbi:MAG TPA: DUF2608 domain-containing protein [Lacipirellulaceae bacterium]|jgi:hypothetical protein|nr:DUF2608 domain-containing protein [Lacipirellulaceae bacterium]